VNNTDPPASTLGARLMIQNSVLYLDRRGSEMNQTLKQAIREVEALPEAEQEELAQALLTMAARKRIDAKLAEAEARGGSTPHAEVMAKLMKKYGG
jgi:hypothetical protein